MCWKVCQKDVASLHERNETLTHCHRCQALQFIARGTSIGVLDVSRNALADASGRVLSMALDNPGQWTLSKAWCHKKTPAESRVLESVAAALVSE